MALGSSHSFLSHLPRNQYRGWRHITSFEPRVLNFPNRLPHVLHSTNILPFWISLCDLHCSHSKISNLVHSLTVTSTSLLSHSQPAFHLMYPPLKLVKAPPKITLFINQPLLAILTLSPATVLRLVTWMKLLALIARALQLPFSPFELHKILSDHAHSSLSSFLNTHFSF